MFKLKNFLLAVLSSSVVLLSFVSCGDKDDDKDGSNALAGKTSFCDKANAGDPSSHDYGAKFYKFYKDGTCDLIYLMCEGEQ